MVLLVDHIVFFFDPSTMNPRELLPDPRCLIPEPLLSRFVIIRVNRNQRSGQILRMCKWEVWREDYVLLGNSILWDDCVHRSEFGGIVESLLNQILPIVSHNVRRVLAVILVFFRKDVDHLVKLVLGPGGWDVVGCFEWAPIQPWREVRDWGRLWRVHLPTLRLLLILRGDLRLLWKDRLPLELRSDRVPVRRHWGNRACCCCRRGRSPSHINDFCQLLWRRWD